MTLENGPSRIQLAQAGLLRLEQQPMGLTATLLGRKGLLRLLALPDLPAETAEGLAAAYYSSPRFDVGRSLAEALVAAYDADTALSGLLGGAVVVLDMDVYIVATPAAMAWIVGYDTVQCAFDVRRRIGLPADLGNRPTYAVDWELHIAHWRLTAGDLLVAVVGDMDDPLDDSQVARLAGRYAAPQSLATAVVKAASRPRSRRVGALVAMAAGFAPVPDGHGDTPAPRQARPIDEHWAPRRGLSPIWGALILAVLAIMITVHFVGVDTATDALQEYFQMAFGPEPTATSTPEPTATPSQPVAPLLSAPRLTAPADGMRLSGANITLTWDWSLRLAQGQVYEVRLARAGASLATLEQTAEQQAFFAPKSTGWYEWAVLVVSEQDSPPRPLSELSSVGSFFWSAD